MSTMSFLRWRHNRSGWRHINFSFGGIQVCELNFQQKKTDLSHRHQERLWNYLTEAMFSIFKWEKIDQNELWLGIQKLFHTKSSTLNPMSWSVFSNREVGRSSKLKLRATNSNSYRIGPWVRIEIILLVQIKRDLNLVPFEEFLEFWMVRSSNSIACGLKHF